MQDVNNGNFVGNDTLGREGFLWRFHCVLLIRWRLMYEGRRIVAGGQDKPNRPDRSFMLIDLCQTFTKSVNRYADDRIGLGVKIWPPAKRLDRDCIFLDLICPALEILLTDVSQNTRKIS